MAWRMLIKALDSNQGQLSYETGTENCKLETILCPLHLMNWLR